MLTGLITGLKLEAKHTARRAAFALGGFVFILIGIAVLCVAGWIVLAEMRDPVFASLVVGAVFFGIGIILLGLSRRPYRSGDIRAAAETGAMAASSSDPRRQQAPAASIPPLAEAFIVGLTAGMRR